MSAGPQRRDPDGWVRVVVGWVAFLLAVTGAVVFVALGANRPADPTLGPVVSTSTTFAGTSVAAPPPGRARTGIAGYGAVAFRVTPAPGAGLPASGVHCALLAEEEAQHRRGMMGRTDFGGYDAMVFRFASDTSGPFYMRNVPIPLSIAWFDAAGRFVSSADMEPCPDQEGCPLYHPTGPYRFAVEVPRGGLERLGIGPSSVLEVGGACPPG